jgi:hypothetical protein
MSGQAYYEVGSFPFSPISVLHSRLQTLGGGGGS